MVSGLIISHFKAYIYYFKPVDRIFYLLLIFKAIVTKQSFIIFPTLFLYMFFQY